MARYVHITALKYLRSIRRVGLKATSWNRRGQKGLYAMPVVPNFYHSHQWVRELKRSGQRQMYGVYFHLPDDAEVFIGHYSKPHLPMQAAEAAGIIMHAADVQGYEVFLPYAIVVQAIVAIRPVPHIGWRYFPGAHNRRPCGCPICLRKGEIKSQRIREQYEAE